MPIFLIGTNAPDIGIGDRLSWVWRSDAYQNLIVIVLLVGAAWLLRYASQQEYWRNAARQIRRNRLAMICLFILLGYLLIGVLDSVIWRDPLIRQTDQTHPPEGHRRSQDPRLHRQQGTSFSKTRLDGYYRRAWHGAQKAS